MKKITIFFLISFLIPIAIFSQAEKVFFKDGIVFIKNFNLLIKDTVIDNRTIKYPANWNLRKGTDNTYVTFPDGWILNEGRDGHLVAFPKGWQVIESTDGRLQPILYKEKKIVYKEKKKDCVVSESDDCMTNVTKSTNEYGLYSKEGADGRVILYTKDMNIASSPDGRLVNLPKGWEISQSTSGRFIAYPKNWEAFVLDEGKEVAMPKNWSIDPETNNPKIISENGMVKFIYTPVQKIKLAEAIYNGDKVNGLDYILYMLFNAE